MAAPTGTVRLAPDGTRLTNGHITKVAIDGFLNLAVWEKEVTPPPFQMDDAQDLTTQFNERVRTYAARRLYRMEDMTFTAFYDPKIYGDIIDNLLIGFCTSITLQFPDESFLIFWGYVSRVEAGALSDGEVPEVTITITPTNTDPTTCEEEPPLFQEGSGFACCPNAFGA